MYWLGVTYKDEVTGIYCAGLTTIILPFIYYSQFGRAYSMSLLFFALVLVYYIKVKSENTRTNRIVFWSLAVINVWIHLFAAIPIGLMCLDLLFDKKNWLCGIGASIACLPLLGMLASVLSTRNGGSFNYGASQLQMAFLTFPEFFNTPFLNVLALAVAGAWLYKKNVNKIFIVITVVTLIVGVLGAAITPMFPRYLMSAAIVILLFACVGVTELTALINRKAGIDLTYVVMIVIFIVFIWMMWPNLVSHYTVMQYEC